MQLTVEEAALQAMENAAAEHFGWLKRVNAALLFRTEPTPLPAPLPAELAAWIAAADGCPTLATDRRKAHAALRRAHDAMARRAARLAAAAPPQPDEYDAFMACAECYARELRRIEHMVRQCMAETDPLTGVHNRLGMMRDLDREWQRSMRTGQPCCVALADLDHFKRINDTHGHLAGDKVLSMAARFFVRRLRPYDRVYRYGGEEFLFLLPNTDLVMAQRVLNRLRSLMARVPVRLKDGPTLRITASIGIAEMSSPDDSPNAVMERADRAVYAAKNAGRNRVCIDPLVADADAEVEDLPDMPAGLLPPGDLPRLHR